MDRINKKSIVTPQSLLIEQTALKFAAVFYEAGRSSGLKSKHKDAKAYAKANVERFIPIAVSILLDMLGMPHVPQSQKDTIYDAIMERTNDTELSDVGIPVFENKVPHLPDYSKIFTKPELEKPHKEKKKYALDEMQVDKEFFKRMIPNA